MTSPTTSDGWFSYTEAVNLMYKYVFDGNCEAIDCLMSKLTPSFATMIVIATCRTRSSVMELDCQWRKGFTHLVNHEKFDPTNESANECFNRLLRQTDDRQRIVLLLTCAKIQVTTDLFFFHVQLLSDSLENYSTEIAPDDHVQVINAIISHPTFTDATLFAGIAEWGIEREHRHPMPIAHRHYDALLRVRRHIQRVDELLDDDRLPINSVAGQYSWIFRNPTVTKTMLAHERVDIHRLIA